MKRLIIAAATLFVAACQPMPTTSDGAEPAPPVEVDTTDIPPPVRVPETADAGDCAARGGEMRRLGRMGREYCVVKYADAGKPCTDGAQCQGECRADANLPPPPASGAPAPGPTPVPPAATAGRCQADSDPFGCYTRIENGRGTTICVD
jgi:Uncharacterized lipoprotein